MLWNWRVTRAPLEMSNIMTLAQVPAKLVKALGNLAMPVVFLLAIANIVAVAGTVGAVLFVEAESAVRHLFELQIMR